MFHKLMPIEDQCTIPNIINADALTSYAMCKVFNKIAINLIADVVSLSGCSANTALRISDIAYILLIYGQGSIKTSGTAYMVEEALKLCGVNEQQSYRAGLLASIAVSLGPTLTPAGVMYTLTTTGISLSMKFFTQKGCEKIKETIKINKAQLTNH